MTGAFAFIDGFVGSWERGEIESDHEAELRVHGSEVTSEVLGRVVAFIEAREGHTFDHFGEVRVKT